MAASLRVTVPKMECPNNADPLPSPHQPRMSPHYKARTANACELMHPRMPRTIVEIDGFVRWCRAVGCSLYAIPWVRDVDAWTQMIRQSLSPSASLETLIVVEKKQQTLHQIPIWTHNATLRDFMKRAQQLVATVETTLDRLSSTNVPATPTSKLVEYMVSDREGEGESVVLAQLCDRERQRSSPLMSARSAYQLAPLDEYMQKTVARVDNLNLPKTCNASRTLLVSILGSSHPELTNLAKLTSPRRTLSIQHSKRGRFLSVLTIAFSHAVLFYTMVDPDMTLFLFRLWARCNLPAKEVIDRFFCVNMLERFTWICNMPQLIETAQYAIILEDDKVLLLAFNTLMETLFERKEPRKLMVSTPLPSRRRLDYSDRDDSSSSEDDYILPEEDADSESDEEEDLSIISIDTVNISNDDDDDDDGEQSTWADSPPSLPRHRSLPDDLCLGRVRHGPWATLGGYVKALYFTLMQRKLACASFLTEEYNLFYDIVISSKHTLDHQSSDLPARFLYDVIRQQVLALQ